MTLVLFIVLGLIFVLVGLSTEFGQWLFSMSIVSGFIYIVYHFISKYW